MSASLPPEAWITALVSLEAMTPARFRILIEAFGEPGAAWSALVAGHAVERTALLDALGRDGGGLVTQWSGEAARADPVGRWRAHVDAGVGVVRPGGPGCPEVLAADPEPPVILFHQGDPDVVAGPRVAVVGTRDCTRYGHELAFELGADLARAGVAVVSGLALGIDAAAHAGAVSVQGAPPIAVVGSGLDVIYPRRNGPLWREVARRGVVWSEHPLGTPARAWHFPARNRLIAALCDVVVVVESHAHGGALLTVDEALRRDRVVMAVPGPVRSPASAGTNQLLADGPASALARDATDVLVALGLGPGARRTTVEQRPVPTPADQTVLDAMGWQPVTTDHLVLRTGLAFPELAASLGRLETSGWIARRAGWLERRAKSDG